MFAGTAAFAVPTLRALRRAGHDIAAVVTQPDRPGHRMRLTPSAVKSAALDLGLTVLQPERIRDPAAGDELRRIRPDALVVAAYGQIVPRPVLDIPALGAFNLHGSLLPRHRGASPVAGAILAGDPVTGVTIMRMDELLDHGPILATAETPIGQGEDAADLTVRLAELGADLLVDTLDRLDSIHPAEQDHSRATVSPKLRRQDGELDWGLAAIEIDRRVRAYQPWPGATLPWVDGRLKVLRGRPGSGRGTPGEVIGRSGDAVEVAAGEGSYHLQVVQLPNRRPMPAASLLA